MKKFASVLIGATMLAGSVLAQGTATSVNMVGFIGSDLGSNELNFIALGFNDVGASNRLFGAMVGDQLPAGTYAYFWNLSSQKWDIVVKTTKSGWSSSSNRVISVGEGFFIKALTNMSVNIAGEVPLGASSEVPLVSGYNAVGYKYPVDTLWTNTSLSQIPAGSKLNIWDISNQTWTIYNKTTKSGWGSGAGITIKAGQAFFVNVAATTNVVEGRPFTP